MDGFISVRGGLPKALPKFLQVDALRCDSRSLWLRGWMGEWLGDARHGRSLIDRSNSMTWIGRDHKLIVRSRSDMPSSYFPRKTGGEARRKGEANVNRLCVVLGAGCRGGGCGGSNL